MPTHSERKKLPFCALELYELVRDVESYPEFIPWVSGARIWDEEEHSMQAQLIINFKGLTQNYTSQVTWSDEHEDTLWVKADLVDGPFHHLGNHWVFHPISDNECEIEFELDFAFKSKMLDKLIGSLFDKAVHKMVTAFEDRAHALYGH